MYIQRFFTQITLIALSPPHSYQKDRFNCPGSLLSDKTALCTTENHFHPAKLAKCDFRRNQNCEVAEPQESGFKLKFETYDCKCGFDSCRISSVFNYFRI